MGFWLTARRALGFSPRSRLQHGMESRKGNDFTGWPRVGNTLEAGPGLRNRHGSGDGCLGNFTRRPLRRGCEDDSDH